MGECTFVPARHSHPPADKAAQGLGCQMLRRELTALGNQNHNPTRFGSGGTPDGAAGRTAFMKYAG